MSFKTLSILCSMPAALLLSACNGLFDDVYDAPETKAEKVTAAGELYLDASDWTLWHYIDLHELAEAVESDPQFNTSSLWQSYPIPTEETKAPADSKIGIYTYWYDVFGAGISQNEFRSFYPAAAQEEPEQWSIAIHRNNVRTNGCRVAKTILRSIEDLPDDPAFLESLDYTPDEWSENGVWVIQDRMLQGIIGNQGIEVNNVLSGWLAVEIPPIPPSFTLDNSVFVIALPDGTSGALQLTDYQNATGVKCCLTIKYRYPL